MTPPAPTAREGRAAPAAGPLPDFFSACPLCGGAQAEPLATLAELEFVTCGGCSLVYKSRAAPHHLEDAYYEDAYSQGKEASRQRRFAHRVAKARRQIRAAQRFVKAARVLDVGCSYGYAIQAGLDLGLRASGVDVSPHVVEACRARGYDAHVGTLERMPFGDGSFDILVMKHVLEHASDPARALAEARRLLAPGGALVVAVPDVEYWKTLLFRGRARAYRGKGGREHHVYYSAGTLRQMLERHGFRVRAESKAVLLPAASAPGRVGEALRLAAIQVWQVLARGTRTRRELFFIATREG